MVFYVFVTLQNKIAGFSSHFSKPVSKPSIISKMVPKHCKSAKRRNVARHKVPT